MKNEELVKEGKWEETEYSLTKTDIYKIKNGYKVSEQYYDPDTEKLEETFDYYVIFNNEVIEFSLDVTGYNYYWSGTSSYKKDGYIADIADMARISAMLKDLFKEV